MNYRITGASKDDADFIAEGVMAAIGEEICAELGGGPEKLPEVKRLFTELASRETSQYSYRNSLLAIDELGEKAGVIVAYDGAELHTLRRDFVEVYNEIFGTQIKESKLDDETTPDQIYIDTLMVHPDHRRRGIGAMLMDAAEKKHARSGKPLGLLVDYTNPNARSLYEKQGFRSLGTRRFCGVDMEHMQKGEVDN